MARKNKKTTKSLAKKTTAANINAAASNPEPAAAKDSENSPNLGVAEVTTNDTDEPNVPAEPVIADTPPEPESLLPKNEDLSVETNGSVAPESTGDNAQSTHADPTLTPVESTVPASPEPDTEADHLLSHSHHNEVLAELQEKLEQVESERDDIQEEYDSLLERVTLIKQKLEQRFKELESETEAARAETVKVQADAAQAKAEIAAARKRADEVSVKLAESEQLTEQARRDAGLAQSELKSQLSAAETRAEQNFRENSDLRAKLLKEKEVTSEQRQTILAEQQKSATLKSENDQLKSQLVRQKIMFDQEVLNERLAKENLEAEVTQLSSTLQDTETIALQSSQTTSAQENEINRLQTELKALQAHCDSTTQTSADQQKRLEKERNEAVDELSKLRPQFSELTRALSTAQDAQTRLQTEAQENQLLIGKLRHEAVILNEHLTQSLRMIRKDSEGSTVDKELISNLLVQYATCSAKDTKKFEILQLIANFLDWDDLRRQSTGLMRTEENMELGDLPPTQMVGFVGRLAEYLENRRNRR